MKRFAILLPLAAMLFAVTVQAKSTFLSAFKTRYGIADGTKFDTCYTCHVPGQAYSVRNPYGVDLKAHGISTNTTAAFAGVELLDSDGDGALNLTEIKHGTFPGDPNETVAVENTTWGKIKSLYGSR